VAVRDDQPTGSDPDAGLSGAAPAAAAAAPPELDLPVVEAGAYEVRGELARGGMGRILEAWDRQHERPVALKVLLSPGGAAERRFVREIRLLARLSHPGIVPLYAAGRWTGGEPFFAMKLVAGRSLAEAAAAATTRAARLALLGHVVAASEALAYAHAHGILHRDLKPANVLVGDFGETVVIDWGLAKELDAADLAPGEDAAAAPELTVAGRALGTPRTMAPEQARGATPDPRFDVYALGALLYHVLAGVPPYDGASAREVLGLLEAGPPAPIAERAPGLPVDLVAIVEKAMARRPADRYPDAGALARDLEAFMAGERVSAHAYSAPLLLARWARRHRAALTAAAVAAAALAATATLGVAAMVRERDRAAAARVAAERERAEAEAHRDAADALVDFALVELRPRLASLGRSDALAGVGRAVAAYHAATAWDASPAAVKRRAAALDLVHELGSHP
jgi:eukaryotic-like serine/threonine-protein kinase